MNSKNRPRTESIKKADADKAVEIKSHIDNHPEIDTTEVSVSVNHGSVKLTGAIDNGRAKNLVSDIIANEVHAIKGVSNELNARRDMSEDPKEA